MSALEVEGWARFEEDFGPLTIHERVDFAAWKVAYTIHTHTPTEGPKLPPERFRQEWKVRKPWTEDGVWNWFAAQAKGSG